MNKNQVIKSSAENNYRKVTERFLSSHFKGLFNGCSCPFFTLMIRGGVAKIKGTGKTRRKGAHDGLTSFSVHRNLVPPFTILSMTCQFMVPQQ